MRQCWVAVLGLLSAACLPDLDRVEMVHDTTPPLEFSTDGSGVTIAHGTAMAVTMTAFNSDGELENGRISAFADGTSLDVREREFDLDVGTQFVFRGMAVGSGTLQISVQDTSGEITLPYTVTEQ